MAEQQFNEEALKTEKIQKQEYSQSTKGEFSSTGTPEKPTEYGKIQQKSKKIAKAFTIVVTIVGAGLVLGSILEYSFVYKPTAVVEKFDVEADTHTIKYDVVIKDMDTEFLTLKLHNQFLSRTEQIIIGENIGEFTGLQPGINYTISIIEKDVLVKKQTISTKLSD